MSSEDPLIRIQELHRDFVMGHETVRALDGVSLTVSAGEFLGVMGPSGSGKSTLLYLMGGLDRPTAGHIWVHDQDITALDENGLAVYRRRQVGFVFQTFNLISTMGALENVEFPMLFARVPPAQRRERAHYLLELMGLADRMGHKPTELSGGQQQRVAMARALVNDPTIILADEPTGNLDSHTGAEVMAILAQLNREQGRTIVVVSHDPSIIDFTSRCVHLLDGRVAEAMTNDQWAMTNDQ
ncbi:MAG TPA: ABC transporter ATP-binding protein [Anaerolineae bacterium]|nr:ABC transporter ATP-binding protein [Anaerolineae bacterium]